MSIPPTSSALLKMIIQEQKTQDPMESPKSEGEGPQAKSLPRLELSKINDREVSSRSNKISPTRSGSMSPHKVSFSLELEKEVIRSQDSMESPKSDRDDRTTKKVPLLPLTQIKIDPPHESRESASGSNRLSSSRSGRSPHRVTFNLEPEKEATSQRSQDSMESPKSNRNTLLALSRISTDPTQEKRDESPKSNRISSLRSNRSPEKDHHLTNKTQRLEVCPVSNREESSRSNRISPMRSTIGLELSPKSAQEESPRSDRISPLRSATGFELSPKSAQEESPRSDRISPLRSATGFVLSPKSAQEESPRSDRISPLRSATGFVLSPKSAQEESSRSDRISPLRNTTELELSPRSIQEESPRSNRISPLRNTTELELSPRSNRDVSLKSNSFSSRLISSSPEFELSQQNKRDLSPKSNPFSSRLISSSPEFELSKIGDREVSPKSHRHRISPARRSKSPERDHHLSKKVSRLDLSQICNPKETSKSHRKSSSRSSSSGSSRSPHKIPYVITVFAPTFDDIDIPVIPYKIWEEKVLASVENKIADMGLNEFEITETIDNIKSNLLNHSSILTRISQAIKLTSGTKKFEFLKNFSTESNPNRFKKKYALLEEQSSEMCNFLYDFIGRDEAMKILENSTSQAIKTKIELKAEMIVSVDNYLQKITNSSFIFKKSYDQNNLHIVPIPIYLTHYSEFEDNFRSQYSDGPFPNHLIRINGNNCIVPNYIDLKIKEEDRPIYFQKWLITKIQNEFGIKSDMNVEDQIMLFREISHPSYIKIKKSQKLRATIIECLTEEFSDMGEKKEIFERIFPFLEHLESKLKKNGLSTDFTANLFPFCDYISKYPAFRKNIQGKEWNDAALALISTYHRCYQFNTKRKSIPSLALLQAMLFSTYAPGDLLLRNKVCPSLFNGTLFPYRLTLNRDFITTYDIMGYGKSFEVKHLKAFKITSGDVIKALVSFRWTMKGELDSIKYTSALDTPTFIFKRECPYEERLFVCSLFNLDVDDSPWGDYLERKEKNRSFNQPIF